MPTKEEIFAAISKLKEQRAAILAEGTDEPPESFMEGFTQGDVTGNALDSAITGIGDIVGLAADSIAHPIDSAGAIGNSIVEGVKAPISTLGQNLTDLAQTLPGVNTAVNYAADQLALGDYPKEIREQIEPPNAKYGEMLNEDITNAGVSALTGKIGKFGKPVVEGVANTARKVLRAIPEENLIARIARNPKAIAAYHHVGKSQTAAEREFLSDVVEGHKTWINSKVWKGIKNYDDYIKNINDFLDVNGRYRETLVRHADEVLARNNEQLGVGGVKGSRQGPHVMPIDKELRSQFEKLSREKDSAYASLSAQDRDLVLEQVSKDFADDAGNPIAITPGHLYDKLITTYEQLRKLRTFDDTRVGASMRNPGQAASGVSQVGQFGPLGGEVSSEVAREVLGAYARGLKNALNDSMEGVIRKYGVEPEFKGVSPRAFKEASDNYHGMRAFRDAAERENNMLTGAMGPDNPDSLTAGVRGGEIRQAGDVLVDSTIGKFIERSRAHAKLDMEGENVAQKAAIGEAALSGPRISKLDVGLTGAALPASAMAQGSLSQPQVNIPVAPMIVDDSDFINGDPDEMKGRITNSQIPETVKQTLLAATDGTPAMRRDAVGKAKMMLRQMGVPFFAPTPLPGFNSFVKEQEGGYITDMSERIMFGNEIFSRYGTSDPRKALALTQRLSTDGYVPYIPDEFKRPAAPKTIVVPPTPPQIRSQVSSRLSSTTETDVGKRTDPGY